MRIRLAYLFATWFGSGYSPWAPGTAGSIAALAIAIALHVYAGFGQWHFLALAALIFLPAVWAAGVAEKHSGRTDPGFVVVDEVIGQWITLAGAHTYNWKTWLAALALFRLFDIWKPPPVRKLEELHGGWGINADDALAGIYGALVLWVAGRFNLY